MAPRAKQDRLFLPLTKVSYRQFESGRKHYEFRACNANFNERTVHEGRTAEIRCGYSRPKPGNLPDLCGAIGQVFAGRVDEIYSALPFRDIEPDAKTREEAIAESLRPLKNKQGPFIAFEIVF